MKRSLRQTSSNASGYFETKKRSGALASVPGPATTWVTPSSCTKPISCSGVSLPTWKPIEGRSAK